MHCTNNFDGIFVQGEETFHIIPERQNVSQRDQKLTKKEGEVDWKFYWRPWANRCRQGQFPAFWGCPRSIASSTCNYLPGRTQNRWAAVIGPLYVPFGSFILTDAQSPPLDCFINNSKEYNWHLLNQISLDFCWEGNLKKRTHKELGW